MQYVTCLVISQMARLFILEDVYKRQVYYNYRYYNPQNGRWISREPIIEKQKDNVYSYAYNTPSFLVYTSRCV